jgi:putative ABC transport system permease protein
MSLIDLSQATQAISTAKLRTVLNTLGVVVGVAVTVIFVSAGESARQYVTNEVQSVGFGANAMVIHPGKIDPPVEPSRLSFDDAMAIRRDIDVVVDTVPIIIGSGAMEYQGNTHRAPINGVTANYATRINWPMAEGHFFSEGDVEARRRVCVLGPKVKEKLFGPFPALGERIRLRGASFAVRGVLSSKGEMFGFDLDDSVLIPVTSAETLMDTTRLAEIAVWVPEVDDAQALLREAQQRIEELLLRRHRGTADFHFHTQQEMLSILGNLIATLTWFVVAVTAISLAVGALGIFNVMLASITQRTREIGLRKAVGATDANIFWQFLYESMLVGIMGGAVGLAGGVGVSVLVLRLIDLPTVVPWWGMALGLGFSLLVGIASGLIPALRASRLSPVDALRYE